MNDFTPWSSLAGGILIGLSASLLLIGSGRVAGISGLVAGLIAPAAGEGRWRAMFLGGLVASGLVVHFLWPQAIGQTPRGLTSVAVAGLFVGVGTRLGGGCTSGHGVCGMSRASPRSLVATIVFIATGVITTTLVRVVGEAP